MTDLLVYAAESRADSARGLLAQACAATGLTAQLELYGSGSLYQRLGHGHTPPPPDIVMWWGPFAARAAAIDGLLQPHRPATAADAVVHDPDWKWTALEYWPIAALGASDVSSWRDLAGVPRLAIVDPERSELGMAILLATLSVAGDNPEATWSWWQARARAGLALIEDDAGTAALLRSGAASHALTFGALGGALTDLPLIAHAVGLSANSPNVQSARRLLDWLLSEAASAYLHASPWHMDVARYPALDVDWARQQYAAARRRWAQSGFAPTLAG